MLLGILQDPFKDAWSHPFFFFFKNKILCFTQSIITPARVSILPENQHFPRKATCSPTLLCSDQIFPHFVPHLAPKWVQRFGPQIYYDKGPKNITKIHHFSIKVHFELVYMLINHVFLKAVSISPLLQVVLG